MRSLLEQKLYIPTLLMLSGFCLSLLLVFDGSYQSTVGFWYTSFEQAVAVSFFSLLGSAMVYYWMSVRNYSSNILYSTLYLLMMGMAVFFIFGNARQIALLLAFSSIVITFLNVRIGLKSGGSRIKP